MWDNKLLNWLNWKIDFSNIPKHMESIKVIIIVTIVSKKFNYPNIIQILISFHR